MDETINLFEFISQPLQITKPLRLIELFAGYGSQALALKYLGVPFEHWKIAEWNYKSFDAYNRLHMADKTDYSNGKSKEWLIDYLHEKGISADWNKAMTFEQIKRMPENRLRSIYNDIQATHNLVNISKINGNDLEIDGQYTYILTYSFPCQDLSLAGNTAGMAKDSGTRSGLLWEVERLLKECDRKPDILLMENVTQIHNQQNMPHFREWMLSLEKMGYSNYWQDLIGTDYGIPQIRNRTFMISIQGDYFYNFPQPVPLEKKLKDALEKDVDEKYFLSDKGINYVVSRMDKKYTNIDADEAITVCAKGQNNWTGSFVSDVVEIPDRLKKTLEQNDLLDADVSFIDSYNKIIRDDGTAGTINARIQQNNMDFVAIKTATKKGYEEAEEGDGIDISTRSGHRGTVQKAKSHTVNCGGGKR